MEAFLYWFAFSAVIGLGLAAGSFLNSFIYRFERGEGVVFSEGRSFARSRCPACRRVLRWFELIPLLSFFALGRECRTCRVRISWQYPIVELLAALLFAFVFWQFLASGSAGGFDPSTEFIPSVVEGLGIKFQISNIGLQGILSLLFSWYFVAVLVVVAVFDARAYIIPDRVIWPAIFVALVYNVVRSLLEQDFLLFLRALGAGLGAAGFFWSLVVVSRGRWLGRGDVKLVAFLGLVLGWPGTVPALALAFWSGAIVGGALLVAGRKKISSPIPFGPYLVFGALVVLLLGDVISQTWWFVRFLFE